MKKKFTLLITALALLTMMVQPGRAWGQATDTYSLTPDQTSTGSSATSYITTITEFTYEGVSWKMNQWNPKTLQVKTNQGAATSEFRFYNSSAFSGRITQVVITFSSLTVTDATGFKFIGGTSEISTTTGGTAGTWNSTSKTITWTPGSSDNFTYFAFYQNGKVASGSNYLASSDAIVVTYETGGGDSPSITANNVEIAYDATGGSIAYTIENEVTGGVLTAATTSDWLTLSDTFTSPIQFTCSANEAASARTATVTLTYTYNTSETVTKNVTVTQAGNPNVVNNIEDITATGSYTVQGSIVAISNRGFILGDGTGYVYYYYGSSGFTPSNYAIGDKKKLSGSVTVYGGVYQFGSSTTITTVETSNYTPENPTILTGTQMDTRVASTTPPQLSDYIQYQGKLSVSGTYYNITDIEGATTAKGSISYPTNTDFTSLNGKTVTVTGYYVGISSSTYYNTMIGSIEEVETEVAAPTFSPAAGTYSDAQTVTISCETDGATIYYTTNGTTPTSGSTQYTETLNVSTTTTFKAIAIKGSNESTITTATYHINSQANPYTVAQALAFHEYPANEIYVHGIVSTAPTAAPNNGQLTYFISDNGEATNQLQVYKGKGLDNENFTAQDDIQVGDIVTVYGNVKIYNSIKEFDAGNYLVEFERPVVPSISADNVNIEYSDEEGEIVYTINNPVVGGVLTADTEADWLILDDVDETVPFICDANTATTARTATVTLTYTYNTNQTVTKDVTVTQGAAPQASIVVEPASVSVDAEEHDGTLTITVNNMTVEADDLDIEFYDANEQVITDIPTWIVFDDIEGSGEDFSLYYTIGVNNGEARAAYIKVFGTSATDFVYSNLVTINQSAPVTPGSWVLTNLADLTENDIFVIVGTNSTASYAMTNDNGNSNPLVSALTISNNQITSTVADNMQWNIVSVTNGYKFQPAGTSNYLAYSGSGTGMKVQSNDANNVFTYGSYENNNYLQISNRYVCVYNDSDWRAYTNSNIVTTNTTFYKKVTGPVPTEPSITLDSYSIESTAAGLEGSLEVTYANYENPDDIEAEVWFCDANGETAVEYDWIIAAIDDKDVNNLYYIIDANTGDARTAYFKVLESSEGISSDLVTVTQEAYVAPTGTITVAPALVEATAAETEGNLAMTLENIVITEEGYGEFDLIFCDENGESLTDKPNWFAFDFPFENNAWSVSYSIEENTETAAREAYFKVYGLGDDGETEAYSNLVHVTQAGVVQTYLVSFELDGGTFVPNDDFTADIVEKEAGTYTLPSATKANINFAGWLLDGTETVYAAGAQYEVSDDVSFTAQWTNAITATITFGSAQGSTNINNTSITGDDSNGNTWTITTVGTTSFTPNAGYAQIGSSSKPATSITFTTTLPNDVTITAFEAKFGGFSGTAGIIALKVGETTVGSGSLNATTDVTVNNTSTEFGNVLTVSVTGIAKGVKAYYISYSYETGTDPIINAPATVNLSSTDTEGEFEYSIVNPATGVNLEATTTTEWISNITVTDDKVTFNTTANTSETDDREGTITLSYTGAENKTVTVIQSKVDYASLPFEFTGGYADIASTNGLTEDEIDPNDYSGVTTKLKFNTTGDWLVLKLDASPTSLSYDIKGNTFSGGTFDVLTSADGVTYENLATYTQLGATQTVTHVDLASTVRYIKWIYTNKSSGNVGLGNIRATENYDIYGNATADHLNIPMDKVCTVYSGATLNIGVNGLSNEGNATNLIIKDGGQLYTPTAVSGTVEKNITGYGASTNSGYYLVSAPAGKYVYVAANNTNVDVYHFNAYYQGEEWRNFKTATGAWNITPENAALYASKNDTTLVFNGVSINYISGNPTVVNNDLPATNADISVPVSFNSGKAFQGLNLIGNPFTCKAYLSDGRDFYRMNAAGDGFILDTETNGGGHAINVCEGIFVVTTASETNVTFTTTDPTVANAGNNNSMINISLNQVVNRGEQALVDNARVRFGEGNAMRKFSFNDNTAKVYFTEGDQEYAVVRSEGQGEMPVNFKAAENGTYTISVDVENTEMAYLHLIDNKTGMDVDLLQTPSYTFEARTIDYASRFKLVFNANLGNADLGDDFGFISNGNLLILGIEGEATLQVMDITGRILSSETFSGSYNKALNTKAGVYMLRLIQGNETRTQKIVVK